MNTYTICNAQGQTIATAVAANHQAAVRAYWSAGGTVHYPSAHVANGCGGPVASITLL